MAATKKTTTSARDYAI